MGLHDMIQPSFTFLVGVALPYSIHSRMRKGRKLPQAARHTIWRSLLLVALGIFLRSIGSPQTNFTFEDTLPRSASDIPSPFCSPIAAPDGSGPRWACILFGYWLAWALYPAPGPNFDYAAVGVSGGLALTTSPASPRTGT